LSGGLVVDLERRQVEVGGAELVVGGEEVALRGGGCGGCLLVLGVGAVVGIGVVVVPGGDPALDRVVVLERGGDRSAQLLGGVAELGRSGSASIELT
jgi:hypothetical protein